MAIPAASFEIDPATGDLAVDEASGQVRMLTGSAEVAQAVKRRLSLWEGEFFFDRRDGVPWQMFFGKRFDAGRLHLELLTELHRERRLDRIVDLRVAGFDPSTRTVTIVFAGIFRGDIVRAAWGVRLE